MYQTQMAERTQRPNRYKARCYYCNGMVAENAGNLLRTSRGGWMVAHLSCKDDGQASVSTFIIGDEEFTRNRRGRCEDAPCCGCCTI